MAYVISRPTSLEFADAVACVRQALSQEPEIGVQRVVDGVA